MGKVYLRHRFNVHERVLGDVSIPSRTSPSSVPDMRHVTVAHALTNYRSLSLFLAFMKDNNNKDKEKNLTPPRRSRGSRRLFILQQRTPHVINEF